MTPIDFAATFGPLCVAAMLKNGGFASVRLAQIALESNWGEATPKDIMTGKESFNLTGVKGIGPDGSVDAWTHEEIDGGLVKVLAQFRAYGSYEQHIMERDKIFEWDNYDRYRAAKTWGEACDALQQAPFPYATDSSYALKLANLIVAYDFDVFDRYLWVDVGPSHDFYSELAELKAKGYLKGQKDHRLGLSLEAIRVLVITKRMIEGMLPHVS